MSRRRQPLVRRASVDVARAGLEAIRDHGIVNLRYGCYRHAGDRTYIWGNFTGTPEHILCAVTPAESNTSSAIALVAALLASVGQDSP